VSVSTHFGAALIGLLAGLGAYVFSCAVHVWRNRNRNAAAREQAPVARRLARWSALGVLLGLGLVALVAGWRELTPREGYLTGEGLLTVRLPQDLEVTYVTEARTVKAGAVLARFSCPQREARIRMLELHQVALETQQEILTDEPLKLDPELVRRYQSASADKRQLRASLDQLGPARNLVVREELRHCLATRERLCVLAGQAEQARKELEQASAKLRYSRQSLKRTAKAAEGGGATSGEVEDRQTEVQVLEAEVGKLQAKLKALAEEREQLERGLREFVTVASGQTEELSKDLSQAQEGMGQASSLAKALFERLERDASRAKRLRQRRIEHLDVEIAQAKAELVGLRDSLVATAPFCGQVVCREASPRTAGREAPLLVLAGGDALRLRLRLSAAETAALAREPKVKLELIEPEVQRRFTGTLIQQEDIPAEPGYVVAEVACQPPWRTVHKLASDTTVCARLAWRPPLSIYPLCWAGVALAVLGATGWVLLSWRARQGVDRAAEAVHVGSPARRLDRLGAAHEAAADLAAGLAAANSDPARWWLGRDDASDRTCSAKPMRVLGESLAVMIGNGRRDGDLLDAIEWVLAHGPTRAIVHIRKGLNNDLDVHRRIRRLQRNFPAKGPAPAVGDRSPDAFDDRLVRVLRIVAADLVYEESEEPEAYVSRRGTSRPSCRRPVGEAPGD